MKLHVKTWLKIHFHWLILALLAICFFIGTSSYNFLTQKNYFIKWASPDETANYIFAKLYAQKGELSFFEKYNLYSGEIMHPRSVRSDAGWLKPVSFLGIILIYGKIASIFGYKIIPYLTPLFAAVGIIYFYFLIKKIFGKTNALISACLLASLPPYIYYSTRSMFHNVLFIVLLVIGLYYLVNSVKNGKERDDKRQKTDNRNANMSIVKSKNSYFCFLSSVPRLLKNCRLFSVVCRLVSPALAGTFIGLAMITRSSELLWLAPMLLVLWIFNIRKFGLANLLIFLSFLGLAILPALYWNTILFGSPLKSGYPEMNRSIYNIVSAGSAAVSSLADAPDKNELISKIKENIFYFGIHPRYSLQMFNHYFVRMFYWIFWTAVAGLIIFFLGQIWFVAKFFLRAAAEFPSGRFCRNVFPNKLWKYLISCAIMSVILLFYYGSWEFHDNPDPNQYTIGNSYTRYWLPIYLAAIPFAALAIDVAARLFRKLFYAAAEFLPDCLKIVILRPQAEESLISKLYLFTRDPSLRSASFRMTTKEFSDSLAEFCRFNPDYPMLSAEFPSGKFCHSESGLEQTKQKFFSFAIRPDLIAAAVRAILVCAVFFISLQFVLFGSDEGLVYAIEKNRSDRNEYEKVLALTESNSVIITKYHDKLFFPERKVIVGLFDDDNMIREYANAAKYIPVYYYNFTLPPRDIAYLNSRRLPAFGLKITEVEQVNGDFSLYQLENK